MPKCKPFLYNTSAFSICGKFLLHFHFENVLGYTGVNNHSHNASKKALPLVFSFSGEKTSDAAMEFLLNFYSFVKHVTPEKLPRRWVKMRW